MLGVSLIHQQNAHVQTSQTQERPSLQQQQLIFYILSGSRTFMQAICVTDTHMFLFSCTHKVGHNNTACRLSLFFFFPTEEKNIVVAERKVSRLSCLRVLWIEERRHGGGGGGVVGGGQWLWHYVA